MSYPTQIRRGLLAVLCLCVAACSTYESRPTSRLPSEDIINPPRSDRGNPSSYEVFGKRYFVLQSGDAYRDTGIASWYGRDFQGSTTSSGERYDMYAFTAAHKTLPIPTWVEVTNRRNGRTVIVKVNDRGPFVDGRIIDLSYAAALQLGMIGDGTAPVFVRALGAPGNYPERMDPKVAAELSRKGTQERLASSGADAAVESEAPAPLPSTYIQVGAYSERENALRMVNRLRENGYQNTVILSPDGLSSLLHRVRIGPILDGADLALISDGLKSIGIGDVRVVSAP